MALSKEMEDVLNNPVIHGYTKMIIKEAQGKDICDTLHSLEFATYLFKKHMGEEMRKLVQRLDDLKIDKDTYDLHKIDIGKCQRAISILEERISKKKRDSRDRRELKLSLNYHRQQLDYQENWFKQRRLDIPLFRYLTW